MQVSYWYNVPVPSHHAAMIQVLNTARALCELGIDVRIHTGPRQAASNDEVLAFHGLTPHERLRIVSSPNPAPSDVEQDAPRSGPHFVIARGEPGLDLLEGMGPPGESTYILWEAHRRCFDLPAENRTLSEAERVQRVRTQREREAAALERADGILCISHGALAGLEEAFGVNAPAIVLPSGVRLDNTPVEGDAREIDVLYAGKLRPRKGVDVLIEAMRFLPGRSLILAGGGDREMQWCRSLAEEHGVTSQVSFAGFVPPSEMPDLYRRASVGTCPLPSGVSVISDRFTSPLKLLDMMALGTPIVASDVGPVRDILGGDGAAFLVDPNSARRLADGIRRLLEDRVLACGLAARARKRVEAYSWDHRAKRLRAFIEHLAALPPKQSPASRP